MTAVRQDEALVPVMQQLSIEDGQQQSAELCRIMVLVRHPCLYHSAPCASTRQYVMVWTYADIARIAHHVESAIG